MDLEPAEAKILTQEFYASSPLHTRSVFAGDEARAREHYRAYLEFVVGAAESAGLDRSGSPRLLDVGCGCGWSSSGFADSGFETTGVDLNASAFEPPARPGLRLVEGSALKLPFPDRSFDIVSTYQCLEHVPDPERALKEMIRVCDRGGVVAVVGPNLVTPWVPLSTLVRQLPRGRLPWRRMPSTPRHPSGNTVGEIVGSLFASSARLIFKVLRREASFTMRVPDHVPPFDADNDACYLCNPTDLVRYFRASGLTILNKGRRGRPPLAHLIAGGTWVAARNP